MYCVVRAGRAPSAAIMGIDGVETLEAESVIRGSIRRILIGKGIRTAVVLELSHAWQKRAGRTISDSKRVCNLVRILHNVWMCKLLPILQIAALFFWTQREYAPWQKHVQFGCRLCNFLDKSSRFWSEGNVHFRWDYLRSSCTHLLTSLSFSIGAQEHCHASKAEEGKVCLAWQWDRLVPDLVAASYFGVNPPEMPLKAHRPRTDHEEKSNVHRQLHSNK